MIQGLAKLGFVRCETYEQTVQGVFCSRQKYSDLRIVLLRFRLLTLVSGALGSACPVSYSLACGCTATHLGHLVRSIMILSRFLSCKIAGLLATHCFYIQNNESYISVARNIQCTWTYTFFVALNFDYLTVQSFFTPTPLAWNFQRRDITCLKQKCVNLCTKNTNIWPRTIMRSRRAITLLRKRLKTCKCWIQTFCIVTSLTSKIVHTHYLNMACLQFCENL